MNSMEIKQQALQRLDEKYKMQRKMIEEVFTELIADAPPVNGHEAARTGHKRRYSARGINQGDMGKAVLQACQACEAPFSSYEMMEKLRATNPAIYRRISKRKTQYAHLGRLFEIGKLSRQANGDHAFLYTMK